MNAQDHVLVGVDGTEGGRAALRYGAEVASRQDIGLKVMHVWPESLPPVGTATSLSSGMPVEDDAEGIGREVLEEHASLARTLIGADRVSSCLVRGDRVRCLIRAAKDARLTVLGDEHHPVLDRIAVGTVLTGVAARAATPVVAVPANWVSGSAGEGVFAAVKSCSESAGLIHRAMEIAAETGRPLTLLHAWQLPMIYDEYIASRVGAEPWQMTAGDDLLAAVEPMRRDFPPTLQIRTEIRHAQPARAIVDASARADLIVLARRPHGIPFGHLGGTARAVLRESSCPVEVLPAELALPNLEDLVIEAEGAILKSAPSPGTNVSR